MEQLHPVRPKWYEIGLQLGLPSGDLDTIRDNDSDAQCRNREMLKLWLANAECPTLEALSRALRTKAVGESRLGFSILNTQLEAG